MIMKNAVLWVVSWEENGKLKEISTFSKKSAIYEYLRILNTHFNPNISNLKIFKGKNEYTSTLNRFLEG